MICSTAKTLDLNAVEEAKRLTTELLKLESRGNGDLENAMKRLANRYGLPWRTFWTLRYRNPKHLFVGVFETLKEAHRAECGRHIERLRHELQIAKINGVPVQDLEDQASTLIAELEDCLPDNRDGKA